MGCEGHIAATYVFDPLDIVGLNPNSKSPDDILGIIKNVCRPIRKVNNVEDNKMIVECGFLCVAKCMSDAN